MLFGRATPRQPGTFFTCLAPQPRAGLMGAATSAPKVIPNGPKRAAEGAGQAQPSHTAVTEFQLDDEDRVQLDGHGGGSSKAGGLKVEEMDTASTGVSSCHGSTSSSWAGASQTIASRHSEWANASTGGGSPTMRPSERGRSSSVIEAQTTWAGVVPDGAPRHQSVREINGLQRGRRRMQLGGESVAPRRRGRFSITIGKPKAVSWEARRDPQTFSHV